MLTDMPARSIMSMDAIQLSRPSSFDEPRKFCRWRCCRSFHFLASCARNSSRVLDAPTRWRIIDEDVRRCLTRVFPYGILYTIEPDCILIVAIVHCSRQSGYWKHRITRTTL